jgi:putative ABC transport system permease protein
MSAMRIERLVLLAIKNLGQYRLRASLTMLGIIFGVCSVVAMLSVGEGANQEIQEKIQQMGSNNILIRSVKVPKDDKDSASGSMVAMYGLTYEDARQFAQGVPNLKASTPMKKLRFDVSFRDRFMQTDVIATTPWFLEVQKYRLLRGRFLSPADMEYEASVCVIGSRLARLLFSGYDPIGRTLRISGDAYTVVGIVGDIAQGTLQSARNELWLDGENQQVYIPLKTYLGKRGDFFMEWSEGGSTVEQIELHELILTIDHQEHVTRAVDAVRRILKKNHTSEDYSIVVPLELIRQARETRRLFNIVLGSIAAISLIVGGIGIMNIMLATVSERTREIGIRRALGARRKDIVLQFLMETLILSLSGGLIGLIFGALIPMVITASTNVKTVLTFSSFAIAFSVSVSVSVIFGIYPARRAALMDPIEALRHE